MYRILRNIWLFFIDTIPNYFKQEFEYSIVPFFEEKLFPLCRLCLNYPFALMGNVSAQLKVAESCFPDYYSENNCPEQQKKRFQRWIEKGIKEKNPKALILLGKFLEKEADSVFGRYGSNKLKSYEDFENHEEYSKYLEPYVEKQNKLFHDSYDCFKQVADLGFTDGYFNCARMLDYYSGVLTDIKDKRIKMLVYAAENGSPDAMYEIGKEYLKREKINRGIFYIKKAIETPRKKWFKKHEIEHAKKYKKFYNLAEIKEKALQGDPKAMYEYSEYFHVASFLKRDIWIAHEWHTKAAKAGYVKAFASEASFIQKAWVDGTLEDAFNYYVKAVENGDKDAYAWLGQCYYYGWGTEQNYEKAKYYMMKAYWRGYTWTKAYFKGITKENFLEKVNDGEKAYENHLRFYNYTMWEIRYGDKEKQNQEEETNETLE